MPSGARVPDRQGTGTIEKTRATDPAPNALARPRTLNAQLLQSQRTLGNQAVQKLIRAGVPQSGSRLRLPTQQKPAQRQPVHDAAGPQQASGSPPDMQATLAPPASLAPRITPLPRRAANSPHIQNAWYNFDIPFTDYQFDPSIEGIKTAAGVVKDVAVEAFEWIVDEIKGLVNSGIEWLKDKWNSIEAFVTSALNAAAKSLTDIVGFFKNPLGFLTNALMSLDAQALEKAWAAFSGLITTIANGFKVMTDTLLVQVSKVWSGIDGFATSLLNRLSSLTGNFLFRKLPDFLQRVAFTAIDKLKALWKSINDGWTRLFNKVKAWVDGAIDKVFSFVRKVLSFTINVVITGIIQFGKIVLFLKDLFSHPQKYVELLAQRSVQAFEGVESRFAGLVGQYFGGGKTQARTTTIHRAPAPGAEVKRSATWGEIGHGIAVTMGKKWDEFKANPMAVVKQLLMDLIFPMVGNIHDIVDLFKNIKKVVTGPLSAGSLEEFWTSLLQILDIPIMIYHTVVSILMRTLMVPLIVATFIPHPLVKGIAAAVGYALLGAFVQAEMLNLGQKLLLLKTGATTAAQKEEAYNRIADSLIALAMTAVIMIVMLILHFIANVMKGVYGFVKGKVFGIEPAPVEGKGTAPGEGPAKDAGKGRDTPEGKTGDEPLPEPESRKGVAAERETADGHKVKVMDDGRIILCTTCEEIEVRYKDELKADHADADKIRADLEEVRKMPNGDAKAEAAEKIKQRLDKVRQEMRGAESLEAKGKALETARKESRGAIEDAKEALDREDARKLGTDPRLKPGIDKLRGEAGALERRWQSLQDQIDQTIADSKEPTVAEDPATAEVSRQELDALRDQLEDVRSDAERIRRDIDNRVKEVAEEKARVAAHREQAIADATEARERIRNVCDETDGTNRPGASTGPDKTTESILREEIRTGRPIKADEGHYLKLAESIDSLNDASTELKRAQGELGRAQPPVDDPAFLESLDEAAARASDRTGKMTPALKEWNQRATTNPGVWNKNGTSKVHTKPDGTAWPTNPGPMKEPKP